MSWMRFNLTLVLVLAATVFTAVVQGRMSHRWGTSDAVAKAAARLNEFPEDFGEWHMISTSKLDEESQRQLECAGELLRVYKNVKTHAKVTLLFLLGPTGPTAAHTPEICMGQREFEALGDRREVAVDKDRFWSKRYKLRDVHGESVSVYWAWMNTTGNWIAPADARYTFAGQPFLYKAQVTCESEGFFDGKPKDAGPSFLADFVPVAAKYCTAEIKN